MAMNLKKLSVNRNIKGCFHLENLPRKYSTGTTYEYIVEEFEEVSRIAK
jgi:uncharacterized protein YutD